MSAYEEQFLSNDHQLARSAVKRLTQRIESELIRFTINAPDWYVPFMFIIQSKALTGGYVLRHRDTLYAARMARALLWEKSKSIRLDDFVPVSQTCVLLLQ